MRHVSLSASGTTHPRRPLDTHRTGWHGDGSDALFAQPSWTSSTTVPGAIQKASGLSLPSIQSSCSPPRDDDDDDEDDEPDREVAAAWKAAAEVKARTERVAR